MLLAVRRPSNPIGWLLLGMGSVVILTQIPGVRDQPPVLNGVFLALQSLVDEAGAAGRAPADSDPGAVAGVLTTMLAHVSAHRPGFASWGVEAEQLTAAMAAMIDWSVRGPRAGETL